MAYVPVPKDLTKVKTKVMFNLTRRQLVCFTAGALVGVPLFLWLREPAGNSMAAMCMMLVMMPFFLLAMYDISKTLNEIDGMGQKTFTGKMAISKEDYSQLTALAKEGITSRAEIKSLEQNANYYRQKYFDSENALERMKTKYNELKEKCRPFLEALEHFPEVAKLFTEKVRQLFSFKEAQERAEKEAREKERQERIKARKNKRGMER